MKITYKNKIIYENDDDYISLSETVNYVLEYLHDNKIKIEFFNFTTKDDVSVIKYDNSGNEFVIEKTKVKGE